jgi:methylmalonyl-CoA/ethylmalonyl-CoA epimerase
MRHSRSYAIELGFDRLTKRLSSFMDVKFHHAGWVVPDIEQAIGKMNELFGPLGDVRIVEDSIQKARLAIVPVKDEQVLELIEPVGNDSPAMKYLEKSGGGGVYHVCLEVKNIEEAWKEVRSKGGLPLSTPVPATLFEDRKIFFAYIRGMGLIEFLEQASP